MSTKNWGGTKLKQVYSKWINPFKLIYRYKTSSNKLCNNKINTLQPGIGPDAHSGTVKPIIVATKYMHKDSFEWPVLCSNTRWGTWMPANYQIYLNTKFWKAKAICPTYKYIQANIALQEKKMHFPTAICDSTLGGHTHGIIQLSDAVFTPSLPLRMPHQINTFSTNNHQGQHEKLG